MFTRTRIFAAALFVFGWGLSSATAGLPNLPPYVPPPPPPVLPPPPVITPPPPIHVPPPPPKTNSPEPATLVLGLMGAGIGGFFARRNRAAK